MKNSIKTMGRAIKDSALRDSALGNVIKKTGMAMKDAAAALLQHKKLTLGMMLLDASFILLYGLVSAAYLPRIMDFIVVVGSALSRHAVTDPASTAGFFGMLQETGTTGAFWSLVILSLAFLCSVFLLYTILSGSAWWLSRKVLQNVLHHDGNDYALNGYAPYIRRFAGVSLAWGAFVLAGNVASYIIDLRQTVATGNVPATASPLIMAYFVLIVYVSSISYTTLLSGTVATAWGAVKRSVRESVTSWRAALPAAAALALLFAAIHLLLRGAQLLHPVLMIALGILLVFPFFSFARVFFSAILQEKE